MDWIIHKGRIARWRKKNGVESRWLSLLLLRDFLEADMEEIIEGYKLQSHSNTI